MMVDNKCDKCDKCDICDKRDKRDKRDKHDLHDTAIFLESWWLKHSKFDGGYQVRQMWQMWPPGTL